MSLRQILWGLVLLLLLLAGWQFLRALRLGRTQPTAQPAPIAKTPVTAGVQKEDDDEEDEDGFDYAPQLRPVTVTPPVPPSGVAPGRTVVAPEVFQFEFEIRQLRREREEHQSIIALQQAEIEALRVEVAALRQQLEDTLVEQPATSPEYTDALRFAEQGHTAEEIAARCGISVAEAGLVLSLARTGGGRA